MTKKSNIFILLLIILVFLYCKGQSYNNNMNKEDVKKTSKTSVLCNTKTGMCETNNNKADTLKNIDVKFNNDNKIKIIYFTDPICSSCWGIEPQLRKLKLEYGKHIEIEYKMGGLLSDWSYNSGGISKPSDVAKHWDEASEYYNMPIDGDVWLEDPLESSYPPSIAFKAAQLQGQKKAMFFLRRMREMVFLEKINIAKWENIEKAAKATKLDIEKLKIDILEKGKKLFYKDLEQAKEYGVRGFPTIFFIDKKEIVETVYGARPYAFYEMGVLKTKPNIIKTEYNKDWEFIFSKYKTLTLREYSDLTGNPKLTSKKELNLLTKEGKLNKLETKNGSIWKLN